MADFYTVTGTLGPDATGNYDYAGEYEGEPWYLRVDDAWRIYYNIELDSWFISADFTPAPPRWICEEGGPEGQYNPVGGAVGIATVTLGVAKGSSSFSIPLIMQFME